MVGLVEAGLAAGERPGADSCGIGEFPADSGLRWGGHGAGDHDKRIARGGREIARDDRESFEIAGGRRRGADGGRVPAHFEQAGIFGRRLDLIGALALDGDGDPGEHVGGGAGGRRKNALFEGDGDIALGVGGTLVIHRDHERPGTKTRAIHHEVITHLGAQPGRAAQDEGAAGHRGGIANFAIGPDDNAVGQARGTCRRIGVRSGILRRQRRRIRDRH